MPMPGTLGATLVVARAKTQRMARDGTSPSPTVAGVGVARGDVYNSPPFPTRLDP